MKKRILIIGNGFDISLGRKTTFSEFVKSEYWKKIPKKEGLGLYLNKKKNIDNWFDLEECLRRYAVQDVDCINQGVKSFDPKKDKEIFDLLVEQLSAYLREEESKQINPFSTAAVVFEDIIHTYYDGIYSFNYTDLALLAGMYNEIYKDGNFKYTHIHGSLLERNAILGIQEASKNIKQGYDFLYKVFNDNYKHCNLQQDLHNADDIVIFGHSLGKNDYHFFEDFFKEKCASTFEKLPNITIVCYDEESRLSILRNLEIMTEGKTDKLFDNNVFTIVKTDKSNPKLHDFYEKLKEDRAMAPFNKIH